jgi:hypothetical protein
VVAAPLAGQGLPLHPGGLLVEPGSARMAALAGAGAAIVGDDGNVFVNPAGMAPIRRTTLGGSIALGPGFTRLATASYILRLGRFDVGFGAMARDWGDTVVLALPAGDTTLASSNLASWAVMGVGAAAYRRGILSIGVSGKATREYIADSAGALWDAAGVTGDIGAAITIFDIMAIGATIQNFAGTFVEDHTGPDPALPRTVRAGYTLAMIDPQGTMRLALTAEWIRPPSRDSWWALAAEGGVAISGVGVLARAGYAAGRAGADARAPSFGAGVVVGPVRFDYAYQTYHTAAGASHRLGARLAL